MRPVSDATPTSAASQAARSGLPSVLTGQNERPSVNPISRQ
jgi:OOP family OmpA-OmpF porin